MGGANLVYRNLMEASVQSVKVEIMGYIAIFPARKNVLALNVTEWTVTAKGDV